MATLIAISLGARAEAQAAAFGLCFAAGIAAGIFALLYFRRSNFAERVLSDLFATLALAAGAVLCAEFFLDGKPELYGIAAYLAGASVLPIAYKAIKKRRSAKCGKRGHKNTK